MIETLQAELRSEFQTKRQIQRSEALSEDNSNYNDTSNSVLSKELLPTIYFDETIVRYNWQSEREYVVFDIEIAKK